MSDPSLGRWGEDEAARYLRGHGLKIEERLFRTRWGEVDLVAREGDTWVFVEVKTRAQVWDPSAADAITAAKRRRLINAALMYMKRHRLEGEPLRFDVLLIEGDRIEWIRDAFQSTNRYTY